jgi:hypothetical protein
VRADDLLSCEGERRTAGPSASSDFLLSSVALVHFMRLSLKKAAHAVVDESSVVGNPEFARDDKGEGGGPPLHW